VLAIENAWKVDYRGDGAALFKSGLDDMNESRGDMLYANFVPIVQSSGMGKSRLVDETAKLIFTIPFCFRTEEDGEDFISPSRFMKNMLLSPLLQVIQKRMNHRAIFFA
jgi:hypothetical protein